MLQKWANMVQRLKKIKKGKQNFEGLAPWFLKNQTNIRCSKVHQKKTAHASIFPLGSHLSCPRLFVGRMEVSNSSFTQPVIVLRNW